MKNERLIRFLIVITVVTLSLFTHTRSMATSSWVVYTPQNSLVPTGAVRVAFDQDGIEWFATGNGALSFDGTTWATYSSFQGTNAVAVDNKNVKWFGTYHDGLYSFDGSNWKHYLAGDSGLPSNNVRSIANDPDGSVWFGTGDCCTAANGAAHFDGINWQSYTPWHSGLPDRTVISIAVDHNDVKWFGTWRAGIVRFDNAVWTYYNTSNSPLPHDEVWAEAVDQDGSLWFATGGGLAHFDGVNWHVYTSTNSGIPGGTSSLVIDPHGTKWMGTSFGLVSFDGTTWTTYDTSKSQIPDDYVTGIAADSCGNILVGTLNGAALFNPNTPVIVRCQSPVPTPTSTSTSTSTNTPTATPTNTPTSTPTLTATSTPIPNLSHIGDLDGIASFTGPKWVANITIKVHKFDHNLLANATVNGFWSGGYTGPTTCTTNGAGQCVVISGSIPKGKRSVTFTITGVTTSGYAYQPAGNHDPDADSNGTTITVNRP